MAAPSSDSVALDVSQGAAEAFSDTETEAEKWKRQERDRKRKSLDRLRTNPEWKRQERDRKQKSLKKARADPVKWNLHLQKDLAYQKKRYKDMTREDKDELNRKRRISRWIAKQKKLTTTAEETNETIENADDGEASNGLAEVSDEQSICLDDHEVGEAALTNDVTSTTIAKPPQRPNIPPRESDCFEIEREKEPANSNSVLPDVPIPEGLSDSTCDMIPESQVENCSTENPNVTEIADNNDKDPGETSESSASMREQEAPPFDSQDCNVLKKLLLAVIAECNGQSDGSISWNAVSVSESLSLPRDRIERMYDKFLAPLTITDLGFPSSVAFIKSIGGRLLSLQPNHSSLLETIARHPPSKQTFYPVSNGCRNIKYSTVDGAGFLALACQQKILQNCSTANLNGLDSWLAHEILKHVDKNLNPNIAKVQIKISFLKSTETKPQIPHIDFSWQFYDKCAIKPLIGFTPLSEAGMYLQIWGNDKVARIVFIPFGVLLFVPGDTIHGGGFRTSIEGNPRLHFYAFIGQDVELRYNNTYVERERDPDDHSLVSLAKSYQDSPDLKVLQEALFF